MIKNLIKKFFSFAKLLLKKTLKFKNLVFNFILPNLFNKRIHIISYPECYQKVIITGKGNVFLGQKNIFGCKLGGSFYNGLIELQARLSKSKIIIGNHVVVNNNLFICAANHIEIGENSLIGNNVSIMDFEAHGIEPDKRRGNNVTLGVVKIGKNVWIGNNVNILKNTTIGDNCIIALGAVVKGDFPANVIIGGIPAIIIKKL